MAKRLYLHIGYPKTGTTMLQACFAANSGALKELGFLYPQTGQIHEAHYAINFALGIGEFDEALNIPTSAALREALNSEISDSNCDNIIVSSEYFSIAPKPDMIKDFFAGYDTTIVAYLRRHDHALESAYAQAVKTVKCPPWEPSLESFTLHQLASLNYHYDYFANLATWAKCFGKSAIVVRPYERGQNEPDLVADFLTAIGVKPPQPEALIRPGQLNRSLGNDALAAIRAVRGTDLPENTKQFIVGRIAQMCEKTSNSRGPVMPPGTTRALITRYGGGYAKIAREYLGRDDGVLFREAIPEDDKSKVYDTISPQATLDLILRAISGALRVV